MKRIVSISGGIDSQACAGWVLDNFPKDDVVVVYCDPGGNDHPLTLDHIRWYSENVHPVVTVYPIVADLGSLGTKGGVSSRFRSELGNDPDRRISFLDLVKVKGRWPSSKARFCTEYLKMIPFRRYIHSSFHVPVDDPSKWVEYEIYVGVRSDESKSRSILPERSWDEFFDCDVVRPILRWTKQQCFDYVKKRGERINPLYLQGFSRVGCAPCILSSKDSIRLWAAYHPEVIDRIREWEKESGRTYFAPMVPGKDINWIDDVVSWSRTSYGGKQYELPVLEAVAESGSCSSKYGLC